ncbi:MAG TPA: cytidine deaminase [Candidatus Binatia bacterium]|jgi:cytidine deaminase|nr:cytidine deaminase [Candidatus Binatia bacterium]
MKAVKLDELAKKDRDLIVAARKAADNAYAPYSGFAVGAAVRAADGAIHVGANLENASYGLSLCAEVSVLTAANTSGDFDHLAAIAVVGFGFFPKMHDSEIVTPCGRCRQLISESAQLSGIDIDVFACSGDLQRIEQYKISELLPQAFGPESLNFSNPSKPINTSEIPGKARRLLSKNS